MTFQTGSQNPSPSSATAAHTDFSVPFLVKLFGSGLFSGYSPVASGTVGSLMGLAIYALPGFENPGVMIAACFIVFVLGIKAAELMERRYGHDPAEVTIDEILGMWISLLFLPKSIFLGFTAFLLFRIFDIVKPWPARKFDTVRGGFGIMMDDVIAAFYTNIILHILYRVGFFSLLSLS